MAQRIVKVDGARQ